MKLNLLELENGSQLQLDDESLATDFCGEDVAGFGVDLESRNAFAIKSSINCGTEVEPKPMPQCVKTNTFEWKM